MSTPTCRPTAPSRSMSTLPWHVERGIAELAITDHVDFDPRDPAYEYTSFEDRERIVRDAAERWAERGVAIRFGAELTFNRRWEADVRDHLAPSPLRLRHRLRPRLARVAILAVARPGVGRRPLARRGHGAVLRPDPGGGPIRAVRHDRPPRRGEALPPPICHRADLAARPDLQEPALRAIVECGTALEVNSSGLRHPGEETYPSGGRRRAVFASSAGER